METIPLANAFLTKATEEAIPVAKAVLTKAREEAKVVLIKTTKKAIRQTIPPAISQTISNVAFYFAAFLSNVFPFFSVTSLAKTKRFSL